MTRSQESDSELPVEETRPDGPAVEAEVLLGQEAAPHDAYLALRNPNYRSFALAFLFSSTSLQMLGTALAWEVYERTQDALQLGYLGLARAAPVILLTLPAGQAADLWDRKRLLFATQATFALACTLLAIVSHGNLGLWLTYALLVLTGAARSFHGPARNSLMPLLVEAHEFHNAVTWNSGVFQLSAICGPLIAGALIGVTGAAWPVYATTACGCGSAAVLALFLRPRPQVRGDGRFTLASMTAGAGHLLRDKTVLAAITLDLFAVLLGGATALMPVYAKLLAVGPEGLGALRAAPYVGAFVMALVLAHRPPFQKAGRALLASVAGFGAATIVFGVSQNFVLSLAMLVLLGALDNISVVIRHVLVQVRTPDALRGRVSAVNSVFIECSNELGAFESGLVAKIFGPVASVVSGGMGTILVVLGIAWAWPDVLRLGKVAPEKDASR